MMVFRTAGIYKRSTGVKAVQGQKQAQKQIEAAEKK